MNCILDILIDVLGELIPIFTSRHRGFKLFVTAVLVIAAVAAIVYLIVA